MCFITVLNMIFIKYPENDDNINKSVLAHSLLGMVGGLLCGLLGVGGGIIMIPILTLVLKYPTHKAIGTSSASIIATSFGGFSCLHNFGLECSKFTSVFTRLRKFVAIYIFNINQYVYCRICC